MMFLNSVCPKGSPTYICIITFFPQEIKQEVLDTPNPIEVDESEPSGKKPFSCGVKDKE